MREYLNRDTSLTQSLGIGTAKRGGDGKEGRADLHMHTVFSDGALSPAELLKRVLQVGLSIVGITDHDSVQALDEAVSLGEESGLTVVPGIELSATLNKKEIHLLGYFIDRHDVRLNNFLAELREERKERAKRMVQKLNRLNIPLNMETVLASAGEGVVGRPHIAAAMVAQGLAKSYKTVFDRFIGDGCPAYEKRIVRSPENIIDFIAEAGGLSFLAHPARWLNDEEVIHLIRAGIDGIEVVHPTHSQGVVKHCHEIADAYSLLECGGSDFHGGMRGDDNLLGTLTIPVEMVHKMRRTLFSHH